MSGTLGTYESWLREIGDDGRDRILRSYWENFHTMASQEGDAKTQYIVEQTIRTLHEVSVSENTNSSNSSIKGAAAEKLIQNEISKKWDFKVSAQTTGSGDVLVRVPLRSPSSKVATFLVEVKNYAANSYIPAKEHDKFLRDLHATHADAGIYFAVSGKITGRSKNFSVEHRKIQGKQTYVPTILMQDCPTTMITAAIDIASVYLSVMLTSAKHQSVNLTDVEKALQSAASHIDDLTRIRSNLTDMMQQFAGQVVNIQSQLDLSVLNLRKTLSTISDATNLSEKPDWIVMPNQQLIDKVIKALLSTTNKQLAQRILDIIEGILIRVADANENIEYQQVKSTFDFRLFQMKIMKSSQTLLVPITSFTTNALGTFITQKISGTMSINQQLLSVPIKPDNHDIIHEILDVILVPDDFEDDDPVDAWDSLDAELEDPPETTE
jgi:hypothetical protein